MTFITDEILSEGGITGTTISGVTFFGDGSNLTGISSSGTFTGGTVTGATNFTNGLTANTISGTSIVVNTIDSVGRVLTESNGDFRIAWGDGQIYNSGVIKLDWNQGQLKDSGDVISLDWELAQLYDTVTTSTSVDWKTRNLIDASGNVKLNWQSGNLTGMTNVQSSTVGATTYLNIPYITGDTISVQARRTTLYTLTNTFTNITFNVTDIENDSSVISHDNVNTDRIYMYESGLYEIHYHGDIGHGTTANDFETRLFLNDLSVINGGSLSGKSSSTDRITFASNTVFSASSGDYITLQAKYPVTSSGVLGNTVLSVKQLKGLKGDTGPTGPQGPQGIGLFTGGTINVDTNFTAGLSATTLNFTTTPTNNNANTEILTRNSTTGDVEYRDSSSLGGGSIDTGKVIALTQIMYF